MEARLHQLLLEHEALLEDLRLVRSLQLPECYIAAGYIRNYIWDWLHGYPDRGRHNDIDVVYFDPQRASEKCDTELETTLRAATSNDKWSVKNQARMHVKNGDDPYRSTSDALSRWPEAVTAIGARLDDQDRLHLCCPHSLDDLFHMVVRRSPLFQDRNYYLQRIRKKEWAKMWPLLTIIED